MSDLHIEFERLANSKGPDLFPLKGNVDLVLLAGDIDVGDRAIDYGMYVHNELSCPVVQIAGNHEFYNGERTRVLSELRRAAYKLPIHFLENDAVELNVRGRRIRILGCVLWTDYELYGRPIQAKRDAGNMLSDHHIIFEGPRDRFKPDDALKLHKQSKKWLQSELQKPFNGITIVMTHHLPSSRSIADRFAGDRLSPAFSSNLDDFVAGSGAALWVHGHTHDSFDYVIGETRVVCNPRGYVGYEVNPKFQPSFAVDV